MGLRASVERSLAAAVERTADELTALVHQRAQAVGIPRDEAISIAVVFRDSSFVAVTEDEYLLEREYGTPGGAPPLGFLRRINGELPALASPLLDKHMGGSA